MKNVLALIFVSSFIFSCAKKEKVNAPSVPLALTANLTGTTNVLLQWKDNSANEDGFDIVRESGRSGNYIIVGKVGPDITSFVDSNLAGNETYRYRIVAHNDAGTGFSNEVSIFIYATVNIGGVYWMQTNLNVDHYRNGDEIPMVTDSAEWVNSTTGAWCYYKNITANGEVYGKLYNWYAINDSRGLAPEGWHVASTPEWAALTRELGGVDIAGGAMKSTQSWNSPNTGATNSSGFSAVAGGARRPNGYFNNQGKNGFWWTTSNHNETYSFYYILSCDNTNSQGAHVEKTYGFSVRCVRD